VLVHTSPAIRPRDLRTSKLARGLIRGECISWLYCGPLGLVLRPLPAVIVVALIAAAAMARRWRR
jgi:hypothetical protein